VPTATPTDTSTPTNTPTATATPLPDADNDGYSDAKENQIGENPNLFCKVMRADVSGDGVINSIDQLLIGLEIGPVPPKNPRMNQNVTGHPSVAPDSVINSIDQLLAALEYGKNVTAGCPNS
jgi:hypothetical protein